MIKKDAIVPWVPIDGISDKLFVESLHDDYEGFRIILRADDPNIRLLKITFDDKLAYRNMDESYLLSLWHDTEKSLLGKTFYFVKNSSFVEYFHSNTFLIYKNWEIKHYAIYTISDCIDIISVLPPRVEWLK